MSVKKHTEFLKAELQKVQNSKSMINRADEILLQYDDEDRVVTSTEIYESLKDKPLPPPLATGHPSLDNIIKGFYPKQHIIFSAPPKSGKTSFIIDLIDSM